MENWEDLSSDALSRRRFLSLISASAALALGSSSCSRADRGHVVPYTKRPREILPGAATYYASTFSEGLSASGVLVKTREGRPIHVEGNGAAAPLRAIADVLGLYDPGRLRGPLVEGKPTDWATAIERVASALARCASEGKGVLLLAGASLSPTRKALFAEFSKAVPTLRPVVWEPALSDGEIVGARRAFGDFRPPALRLDRAQVIVALEADFLGADPVAAENARAFASKRLRKAGEELPRLWAIEGSMSLTGANADERILARPSSLAALAFALAKALSERFGLRLPRGVEKETLAGFDLERIAERMGSADRARTVRRLEALAADLKRAGPRAIVVPGGALPPEAHVACHLLHAMLGAEGNTIDASLAPEVSDLATSEEVFQAFEEAARGAFGAAIFWGVNPAYCLPSDLWEAASAKVPFRVRIASRLDETASACQVVLAENHWLESWGDHEVRADLLRLQQPASLPLGDTRQGEDAILAVLRRLGANVPDGYLPFLKSRWEKEVYPALAGALGDPGGTPKPVSFETFWNGALHDGFSRKPAQPREPRSLRAEAVGEAALAALREDLGSPLAGASRPFELVLAPSRSLYDGRYSENGWLQELPDPVTKTTWGNPAAVSMADAQALGISDGDVLRLETAGASVEAPAIIQPGQAPGVLSIALGYGRRSGDVARGIGANAFRIAGRTSDARFLRTAVRVARTGRRASLARTQEHHQMEGRDLARSWTAGDYAAKSHRSEKEHALATLQPELRFPGEKWGMAIDLSACTGCSACVIACQSENNVPVVGPEGVERSREMHWIRIDRYYEGDPAAPRTAHLPVLCQHCDHAPCETVCPVNATTHSPDGLNQMTYNRCVGTRYCANNCPYKVRRFNFFEYAASKREPETLVFNPEVTVRPRGVMEKCTFCIQRIQDARFRAKAEGRRVRDGEIRPACAAACPTRAIVFGDLSDPESEVAKLSKSDRGYKLLEELGVRPAVTYLARIVNPAGEEGPR